ncbi:DoxX family protein [Hymenobacter sp. BT507]|uniref:DoxX family protein n=1 Tax=Hymenobacter citatus TaxID=2763506 RepID=A0ABR7MFV4_9BACT|nr:DoxX family protein [Hymenobacter citatus]MBC6609969.1 DoxX family protein [Hymenobacter citatus]
MKTLLPATAPLGGHALDVAYLCLRLHLGVSIALGAGWSKLINFTSTNELSKLLWQPGALTAPDWFVAQVAQLGFTYPSPYFWAVLAIWGELVGGLLVAAGLFTRVAAAQLAIQFLIIAFFWYESPELIVGMYYQQLLFWAFVLIAAIGGGRYSFDYWLARRSARTAAGSHPRQAVIAAASVLVVFFTQPAAAQFARPLSTITSADWQPLLHADWHGTLTYRDYRSQQLVTLATQLHATQTAPQDLRLQYSYREPDGRTVAGTDHLRILADGTRMEWDGLLMQLHHKQQLPGHTLQLVLVGEGQDDNRPATIRHTVLLADQRYSVRKEVRFASDTTFLLRHEYQLQR